MTDWPKPETLERMRKAFEATNWNPAFDFARFGENNRFPARRGKYESISTDAAWEGYIAGYKQALMDLFGLPFDDWPDELQASVTTSDDSDPESLRKLIEALRADLPTDFTVKPVPEQPGVWRADALPRKAGNTP